jgi:hypothetical protein
LLSVTKLVSDCFEQENKTIERANTLDNFLRFIDFFLGRKSK